MGVEMKYYCDSCQNYIDEEDIVKKFADEDIYNPPYREDYCPVCGADEDHLWETEECIFCGEPKPEHAYDKTHFCEECASYLDYMISEMVETISNDMECSTDKAKEALLEFIAERY